VPCFASTDSLIRSRPHSASVPISLIKTTSVAPFGRGQLDQRASLQEVVRRPRDLVIPRVVAAALVHDTQRPVPRLVGEPVVDGGVIDRHRDHGMRRDVLDALAPEVHRPRVAQTLHVLLSRSQSQGTSSTR
jgi:hypothetical protein